MSQKSIEITALKPGDILLCEFRHPGFEGYAEALIAILKFRNAKSDEDQQKFMAAAFTILRGLIITFDKDIYTHAAFWDGKGVVEAGEKGVRRNPIDHYKSTNTDVYRFVKNDKQVLGTEEYPVNPLLELADEIVNENLNYSYNTAILMIFLCITRWERETWIKDMETLLKNHLKSVNPNLIDLLFKANHDKFIELFEWLADEMIRQIVAFRSDNGLVCSETVAAIFNQAKPEGKYKLEKPLNSATIPHKEEESIQLSPEDSENEWTEFFNELDRSEFPLKSSSPESSDWQKHADIIYTPHDIARSVNTVKVGSLNLR
mgnify:FL=1|tara:strand:+ start:62486 stop:63439 length:954 start_codon:yes stop_codon:yes gene_type:complete